MQLGAAMRCIWCKHENNDSTIEHIIPEALGCPPNFTLTDGLVCRSCNNGLAHLDQAVIADFDIPLFMSNVPRKRGKPPTIRTRGNMVGTRGTRGPEISINMERSSKLAHDGSNLGPYGKSDRNINASLLIKGRAAETKFSTPIGQNPKFVRGIVKIGFSSLVYFLGHEISQSTMFDPIRDFVSEGIGTRKILMIGCNDANFQNQAGPPHRSSSGYYISSFRLFAMEFVVDLSPALSLFPDLKQNAAKSFGTTGWTWLPLEGQGVLNTPLL